VDSASSEEAGKYGIDEVDDSSENDASLQGKGRKRAAPRGRGRGRGSTQSSKRGRKSDNTTTHRMLMSKDDDNDDDDDVAKRFNKSQPRVTRNYGALRR
jgi:double-strand break repair protein MRE11